MTPGPTPTRKVQPIDFEGKFFEVRGPLNTVRAPQGQPVFVQAGGSPRGRAFAARHANSIIAIANGIDGMRQYREDVRRHAVSFGRNPDDIKVLFLIYPILAETDAEAQAKRQRMVSLTRVRSSVHWPASARSPISIFRNSRWMSRCRI